MQRLTDLLSHCSFRRGLLAGAALVAAGTSVCGTAYAEAHLDARYQVTLGGVPFGEGTWQVTVGDAQFTAAVSGRTTGLLRLFTKGRGASSSRGSVASGQLQALSYSSSIATDQKYDEVRMLLNSGTVRDFVAEPPNPPNPERVPLLEQHRRGVVDPLTAAIMRVPGNGDTFGPATCNRKLAIFDGRMRYDLQLVYKRRDTVRSEKGYQGAVAVCSVYFSPIAGHIPSRSTIKYLMQLRETEMWLAPIAGTRFMVPYRVSLPTPVGQGVLQAVQFLSTPQPTRATATPTGVRPQ